jgi:two-component system, LuxR family, sensor kinase FixL
MRTTRRVKVAGGTTVERRALKMSDQSSQPQNLPPPDATLVSAGRTTSLILGIGAALIGALVLTGYALDWPAVTTVAPGLQAMSPLTALNFCLAGLAVVVLSQGRARIADALSGAAGAVAAVVLVAQLTLGRDPFSETITSTIFRTPPALTGHMSIATALLFVLVATAILPVGRRWPAIATTAGLAALALSGMALLGYAYGVHDLYAAPIFRTIALHTTVGLTALAAATLLLRSDRPPISILFAGSAAGVAARLQLAYLITIPIVGWLLISRVDAGQMGAAVAVAILVIATVALLALMILSGARARIHVEQARGDRARLADIVDGSDDAIIGKTLQGVVTSWNRGAERTFGYSAGEMIGQSLERLFPPELFPEEAEILAKIARGERISHYETVRRRKNGAEIEVSVSISPMRDESGQIIGASKIARNVTEQNRVRARLEEVQAELFHMARLTDMTQMATGLAHELNQPLSAISNYISGAQKLIEKGDLDRAREGCERAAGQVARAGEVIRRMREFVGKTPRQMRMESLPQVIEESGALAFVGMRGAGVKVELRLAPDAPEAFMDKIQIEQVIVNLVRNAAEAMAASDVQRLTVSTRQSGPDLVEVAVADTGHGLPDHVRDRLFQPFTTTKETGMGVGLSLCRTIIDAHGGRIWAEDAPGGGAVFRFTLPCVAAPATESLGRKP